MPDDTTRVSVPVHLVHAIADAILAVLADSDAPEMVRAGAIMAGSQAALDATCGVERGMVQ